MARSVIEDWDHPPGGRGIVIRDLYRLFASAKSVRAKVTIAKALMLSDSINLKKEKARRDAEDKTNRPQGLLGHIDGDVNVIINQLNDPEYIAWRRSQAVRRALESGNVRGSDQRRTLEDVAAFEPPRPSSNGNH